MKKTLRILVVDDELSIRQLLGEVLKPNQFVLSDSGYAALELLQSDHQFDLILLDYLMVGMDGLDTLKKLKKMQTTKDIPVIITSGLSDISDIREVLAAGAVAFISKPFDFQEIHTQIARLFPAR